MFHQVSALFERYPDLIDAFKQFRRNPTDANPASNGLLAVAGVIGRGEMNRERLNKMKASTVATKQGAPPRTTTLRGVKRSVDESRKGIKRRRVGKPPVHQYSPQLSELLGGLERQQVSALRGEEAADLAAKLHSVCSYIFSVKRTGLTPF